MQIQVNTDNNIDAPEDTIATIEAEVRTVLAQLADHLSRVEVHLSDQSAGRSSGKDKRCMLEARPAGGEPLVVTHQAATIEDALTGAARKLKRLLASNTASAEGRNAHDTIRGRQSR